MKTPAGISTLNRDPIFQELPQKHFDVLVIGGGIMGAGIALDAASRGLKVLLAEKQDFAAGTSSRSTKLIHGGLRYLKNLEIELVREVARERQILHHNAPHLVVPEPMLLPLLKNTSYGYWATKAGLTLYDWLGNVHNQERHRMLNKSQTLQTEPLLDPAKITGAGLFTEYRTDDGRLTMEVLKTAQDNGAICLNYAEIIGFNYTTDQKINGAVLLDKLTGKTFRVNARCVINATGPWSVKTLQLDQAGEGPALYHTKGVHLVIPFRRLPLRQAVYFDIPGGRMLFAIPRFPVTYLGTTDTPFTGDLENPETTAEDVTYILNQVNVMFPSAKLTFNDVTSTWAGVRPLLYQAGKKPSEISRKEEVFISASGLITIAGGKLTGYRHLAEKIVNDTISLQFPACKTSSHTKRLPLSGVNFNSPEAVKTLQEKCRQQAIQAGLPTEKIPYLIRSYGTNAAIILQKAGEFKSGNIKPETCLLKAELWYTINFEGVTNLSDFLIRRTGMLYFEREKIESILPETITAFREFLNWDDQTTAKYTADFLTLYEAAVAFKNHPENGRVSG